MNLHDKLDSANISTAVRRLRFTDSRLPRSIQTPTHFELQYREWDDDRTPLLKWAYAPECVDGITDWNGWEPKYADSTGLLDAFVRLADAPDATFPDFATRWGALRLFASVEWETSATGITAWWHTDHLDWWRYYARKARAILSIAADLAVARKSRAEDWWIASGHPSCLKDAMDKNRRRESPYSHHQRDKQIIESDGEEALLSYQVNEWLSRATCVPILTWSKGKQPNLTLVPHGYDDLRNKVRVAHRAYLKLCRLIDRADIFDKNELAAKIRNHGRQPDGSIYVNDELLNRVGDLTFLSLPCEMFTMLGLQLGIALSQNVFRCDVCDNPFTSERALRSDRSRFCGDDCRQSMHRQQARRSAKKRKAKPI
jgi:hypothetical protein